MKRKMAILLALALAVAAAGGMTVFTSAEGEGPVWQPVAAQTGVTAEERAAYFDVQGQAGEPVAFQLSAPVDIDASGLTVRYYIPDAASIDIDADARTSGANYIETTIGDGDNILVLRTYARYSAIQTAAAFRAKMQTDVFYYHPELKRDNKKNNTADGVLYLETFETYVNVEQQFHVVDIHRENGMWFFAFDGLTAIPERSLDELQLSQASVTFTLQSATAAPSFRLYKNIADPDYRKSFVENNFVQFGSDIVTYNEDDTVRYKIADQRAAQYSGQLIRYREQLISAVGFDVRQPIEFEFSYDVSNASSVWYCLGLGRPDVYGTISKMQYDVFDYAKKGTDNRLSDYSDNIALKNDGIMFQTTTGLAQPTEPKQNHLEVQYFTNSESKPYAGRSNMDVVRFVVKEDGTDLYHNGTLLFENLLTKLSDFEDSGYLAYPYFHFFEDNASTVKGNTIVLNGINSAKRTDGSGILTLAGGSHTDLAVGVDDIDNGEIVLLEPDGAGGMQAVDGSLYAYDQEAKQLTLRYRYFTGKEYKIYKLYARNNTGSAEISVRFSDPELNTRPPTVEHAAYTWRKGQSGSLVINFDRQDGDYKSFSGGGIARSNYEIELSETDTTGQIVISGSFLDGKREGTYTFIIRTTNIEEEEFECRFTVTITEEEAGNGGGDNGDGNRGGCKGAMSAADGSAAGAVLVLGLLLYGFWRMILRRRKKARN